MVRTKAREKRAYSCFPRPSDSEDSFDSSARVEMRKKASTSEVLTELRIKKVPDRQVPCTPDGLWTDGKYHFITKAEAVNPVFYYRDLTRIYSQYQPDAHPGPYDESEVSRRFVNFAIKKAPYSLKESFLRLEPHEMDKTVRFAF